MNIIYKFLICTLLMAGATSLLYSQNQKIMTYNIRFDNEQDGLNKWENRKQGVVNLIEYYEPRILGIQEAMEHQLNYLDDNLTNYSRIGVGRDDGKAKGEFCAIYYDNNQLSLIIESTFWLSQRDDRVSVGWDASMERICTYGLFQDKINNNKILIFNTHYDHIGKIAREKSSELILNKIKEINKNGFPVILLGDFNSEPNSKPIKLITKELEDGAKKAKNGIYGPIGTFTGFKINTKAQRRIDYIFIKNLKVNTYRHIDDKMKDNNYLSDHLPVLIELEYLN